MSERQKFESWWLSDVPEQHRDFAKKQLGEYGQDYAAAPGVADAWTVWQASRRAALEEAAERIEAMNDSAGDRASYDNREMYEGEIECMRALSAAADAIRALSKDQTK